MIDPPLDLGIDRRQRLWERNHLQGVGNTLVAPVASPTQDVYGRIGTCNQEFGTLASWLVDVVNLLTGNFDRPERLSISASLIGTVAVLAALTGASWAWAMPPPRPNRDAKPRAKAPNFKRALRNLFIQESFLNSPRLCVSPSVCGEHTGSRAV